MTNLRFSTVVVLFSFISFTNCYENMLGQIKSLETKNGYLEDEFEILWIIIFVIIAMFIILTIAFILIIVKIVSISRRLSINEFNIERIANNATDVDSSFNYRRLTEYNSHSDAIDNSNRQSSNTYEEILAPTLTTSDETRRVNNCETFKRSQTNELPVKGNRVRVLPIAEVSRSDNPIAPQGNKLVVGIYQGWTVKPPLENDESTLVRSKSTSRNGKEKPVPPKRSESLKLDGSDVNRPKIPKREFPSTRNSDGDFDKEITSKQGLSLESSFNQPELSRKELEIKSRIEPSPRPESSLRPEPSPRLGLSRKIFEQANETSKSIPQIPERNKAPIGNLMPKSDAAEKKIVNPDFAAEVYDSDIKILKSNMKISSSYLEIPKSNAQTLDSVTFESPIPEPTTTSSESYQVKPKLPKKMGKKKSSTQESIYDVPKRVLQSHYEIMHNPMRKPASSEEIHDKSEFEVSQNKSKEVTKMLKEGNYVDMRGTLKVTKNENLEKKKEEDEIL